MVFAFANELLCIEQNDLGLPLELEVPLSTGPARPCTDSGRCRLIVHGAWPEKILGPRAESTTGATGVGRMTASDTVSCQTCQ